MTLEDRFWAKVEKTETCWLWTAWKDKNGYGGLSKGAKREGYWRAHIYSYILHKGPVPEGYIVEHKCNNPSCVNPDHLRPKTQRENVMRSSGPAALNAIKTHCPANHEYTSDNTYEFPTRTGWGRSCCKCSRRKPRSRSEWDIGDSIHLV